MFIIKKLLGNLMMPLSFSLLLLIVGLVLLWFSQGRSKKNLLAKILLSFATCILLLASLPYSSKHITQGLEHQHPPLNSAINDLDYIIVLGGGHTSDQTLPMAQRLSSASYYRINEGIRLMKTNPKAMLLLSGYGGSDSVSNAKLASIVAQSHGITNNKIRLFETARDTAEEATLIAPIIKSSKSALVTSATHMPRALSLFHGQGVQPIAAPCYFLGKNPQNQQYFYEQLPQANALYKLTVAWHELVGSFWQKIRN